MLKQIPEVEVKNRAFEGRGLPLDKECFSFLNVIGAGSFGQVFRVASKKTNLLYAVKAVSKSFIKNLTLEAQILKEIDLMLRCNHENVVKIQGCFEDESLLYLVMELASGGSLFKKLQTSRKISEPETAEIITQLARALHYLHSQNPPILHRDLKPENVLISNGKYVIADFGWSNVKDDLRNTYCGTPDYLAPEMIRGEGHDEKLDVWTVGVLMFELLTGNPPFSPKQPQADKRLQTKIMEKNILEGRIPFPPDMSKEAQGAIIALLQPDPKKRPRIGEIFLLPFFRTHNKHLSENSPRVRSVSRSRNDGTPANSAELEARIAQLMKLNNQLTETVAAKERIIGAMEAELHEFRKHRTAPNVDISKTIESLNVELEKERKATASQQSIMNYMYTRAKDLATVVSNFYTNHCPQNLNLTLANVLSYENTLTKLDHIFKNYVIMKKKLANQEIDESMANMSFVGVIDMAASIPLDSLINQKGTKLKPVEPINSPLLPSGVLPPSDRNIVNKNVLENSRKL